MKYIILKNGLPDFNNSLVLPCTDKTLAEKEVARLSQIQNRCCITGKQRPADVYTVKEID
jgi:hypothetical protein